MRLEWTDDVAPGPGGRFYMLNAEYFRHEPPAWSVLVTGEGLTWHREIRPPEPPWPTKARAKHAAQVDADALEPVAGSMLGATVVSARSRSGRRWLVHSFSATTDEYLLHPIGPDVRPARSGEDGRWQGGVRRIKVDHSRLNDKRYWRRA